MVNIDKIKKIAKEKGIKLGYICSQIDAVSSFFGDAKKGKTTISDERLKIIANILDTTPEYLKDETEQKEKPTVNEGKRRQAEISELMSRMNDEQFDRFYEAFRALYGDQEK